MFYLDNRVFSNLSCVVVTSWCVFNLEIHVFIR